jgi:hypothetical protein
MWWKPLDEWGLLDSDFGDLSPPLQSRSLEYTQGLFRREKCSTLFYTITLLKGVENISQRERNIS